MGCNKYIVNSMKIFEDFLKNIETGILYELKSRFCAEMIIFIGHFKLEVGFKTLIYMNIRKPHLRSLSLQMTAGGQRKRDSILV